jgi:nicotinate-nucleotide adenylyltransferase
MRLRSQTGALRIGVLPGAFNPVTRAHLALLESARAFTDELICVVPRIYPHKSFEGAGFDERLEMLRRCSKTFRDNFGIHAARQGLFIEIARELKQDRPGSEIYFICGSDAAERIVTWDYGDPGAIVRHLDEFGLLVAARKGQYTPPVELRHRIQPIPLDDHWQEISSTEVRRRIAAGETWEHLVPEPVVELARQIYAP